METRSGAGGVTTARARRSTARTWSGAPISSSTAAAPCASCRARAAHGQDLQARPTTAERVGRRLAAALVHEPVQQNRVGRGVAAVAAARRGAAPRRRATAPSVSVCGTRARAGTARTGPTTKKRATAACAAQPGRARLDRRDARARATRPARIPCVEAHARRRRGRRLRHHARAVSRCSSSRSRPGCAREMSTRARARAHVSSAGARASDGGAVGDRAMNCPPRLPNARSVRAQALSLSLGGHRQNAGRRAREAVTPWARRRAARPATTVACNESSPAKSSAGAARSASARLMRPASARAPCAPLMVARALRRCGRTLITARAPWPAVPRQPIAAQRVGGSAGQPNAVCAARVPAASAKAASRFGADPRHDGASLSALRRAPWRRPPARRPPRRKEPHGRSRRRRARLPITRQLLQLKLAAGVRAMRRGGAPSAPSGPRQVFGAAAAICACAQGPGGGAPSPTPPPATATITASAARSASAAGSTPRRAPGSRAPPIGPKLRHTAASTAASAAVARHGQLRAGRRRREHPPNDRRRAVLGASLAEVRAAGRKANNNGRCVHLLAGRWRDRLQHAHRRARRRRVVHAPNSRFDGRRSARRPRPSGSASRFCGRTPPRCHLACSVRRAEHDAAGGYEHVPVRPAWLRSETGIDEGALGLGRRTDALSDMRRNIHPATRLRILNFARRKDRFAASIRKSRERRPNMPVAVSTALLIEYPAASTMVSRACG